MKLVTLFFKTWLLPTYTRPLFGDFDMPLFNTSSSVELAGVVISVSVTSTDQVHVVRATTNTLTGSHLVYYNTLASGFAKLQKAKILWNRFHFLRWDIHTERCKTPIIVIMYRQGKYAISTYRPSWS